MEEPKKPPFIPGLCSMDHVPTPDPENFWWLELDQPKVIMVDRSTMEPLVTIVLRKVDGNRVALQIVANMDHFQLQ